jgi:outer membrane receptor for monomeric catechols
MLAVAAALSLAACASRGAQDESAKPRPEPASPRADATAGAPIIITREQLRGGDPNLLHLLRDHVATMMVHTGGNVCAQVTLRGHDSFTGSNAPAIYVDGTRAVDTCVLEMLNVAEIERVEVYPFGIKQGYMVSPTGLILITSRTADDQ